MIKTSDELTEAFSDLAFGSMGAEGVILIGLAVVFLAYVLLNPPRKEPP